MFRRIHLRVVWLILPLAALGCAPSATTTRTPTTPVMTANAIEIERVRLALDAASSTARSLYVEGDITLDQNGESNSATFVMRSKRLSDAGRIDSLSIEVKGPFGIKVARFLASPDGYKFTDILHGETMSGKTDAHALEALTQLRGLSLTMMSDLAYGLAPVNGESDNGNSLTILTTADRHQLVVQRPTANVTEIIDMTGPTVEATAMHVDRYRRWNKIVDAPPNIPPAITIRFSNRTTIEGLSIPQHIEAVAGENKLKLDYTKIELNPPSLTVKIKMPSE